MAGIYSVRATVSGCQSTAGTTTVVVNSAPAAPTAGNGGPVCVGASLGLTANTIAGATYAWTGPNSYTSAVEDPTVSASATTAMAGTYSVRATVNGCQGAAGTTTVVVNSAPAAPTAGNNGPVCVGASLGLTANTIAGATYAWTGPNSYTSTVEDPTVSASATTGMAGIYSVRATVSGCQSTAGTTTVVVNSAPAAPTAGNGGPVCVGASLGLTANTIAGATYAWTGPNSYTSTVEDPTVSATATTAMAGVYSVRATVSGCQGAAGTTTVVVNTLPTITKFTGGGEFCKEASPSLSLTLGGAAPFKVDYSIAGAAQTQLTGVAASSTVTAPKVSGNIVTGVYSISKVTDNNNCVANFTTSNQTITVTPDVVVSNPTAVCSGTDATVSYTVSGGKGAYTSVANTPTAGSFSSSTYSSVFQAIGVTNYNFTFSDASGCAANTAQVGNTGNINCGCPVKGTIQLKSGAQSTICPSATTPIEVVVSGSAAGTPVYDFTITTPSGTLTKSGAATVVGNVYTFNVSEVGNYTIASVQDQTCTGTGTGSVTIANHTLPTASVTGTAAICNQTGVTTNLNIVFTGASPYSVDILKEGLPFKTLTNVTSPHLEPVSGNGAYTIANVKDANCTGTSATGTAAITYKDDVVATRSLECGKPGLAADEFQARITVTKGDLASIIIAQTTSVAGVTFTRVGTTNEWLSNPIKETNSVDVTVKDGNNCNTGAILTGLTQQCSCPAKGAISQVGSATVCPGTDGAMSVTFSSTIGTGPFDIVVSRPSGGDTTILGATASPITLPIRALGAYSATIKDNGNAGCTVSATGSVSLANHTLPTASLTGTAAICNQSGVTTNLNIAFTGASPYSVDILKDGAAFKTLTNVTNPHLEPVSGNGTYTIANVKDANCTGVSATGSAVVTYKLDVLATATVECKNINPTLATDEFQIRVKVTQGDLTSIAIAQTTSVAGVTFTRVGATDEWLSNAIKETNAVSITVKDGNNCNTGQSIPNLQRQCSCPTTASASITGTNPICIGGTSDLEVTFGGGVGPFNVTVTGPTGAMAPVTSAISPLKIPITAEGDYSAEVTNVGDVCSAGTAKVNLKINKPTAEAGAASTICVGEEAILSGSGTGDNLTYDWSPAVSITGSTSTAVTKAKPVTTTVYTLKVTDAANCEATDNVTVTVNASPNITNTVFEESLCSGEVSQGFVLTADLPSTTFNWVAVRTSVSGTNKTGTGNIAAELLTNTTNSANGQITHMVTPVFAGCKGPVKQFVTNVQFTPLVDASGNGEELLIAPEGNQLSLNGTSTSPTILWTSISDEGEEMLVDPQDLKTPITTDYQGLFEYILTATNGVCIASDTVRVKIVPPLRVPNAFSPNGDGTNDTWTIQGIEGYPNAQMSIFNRWGGQVYVRFGGYPDASAWDGDGLPVGTYYYILKLNLNDNDTDAIRGAITITR